MLKSTKVVSKPKRPLSGYNLFYRYKRNMVVEATARLNGNDNDREVKAVIHAVLTAIPGLEDAPPNFPVSEIPPARLNEFRAAKMRSAMEGKLFPNENARNRQHIKVHGMGFVEMGRMMRQMWGQADQLTKDLFCELADVGRVRYKRLAAEYKLSLQHPESIVKSEVANEGNTSVVPEVKSAQAFNKSKEEVPPLAAVAANDPTTTDETTKAKASESSPIPHQAHSSSDPMFEAISAWATKRTHVAATASSEPKKSSRLNDGRRVSSDLNFLEPVPCQAQSYARSHEGSSKPFVFGVTTMNPTADEVSSDLYSREPVPSQAQSCGRGRGDLFEPLPFGAMMHPTANATPADAKKSVRPSYERRVSAPAELDICDKSLFEPLPLSVVRTARRASANAFVPLPVETYDTSATQMATNGHGRRVSTDVPSLPNGSGRMDNAVKTPIAVTVSNGSARSESANDNLEGLKTRLDLQQIFLRNAIENIKDRINQSNSLLPSDMRVFPKEDIVPQQNIAGEKSYIEIMNSSGPSISSSTDAGKNNANLGGGGSDSPEKGGVSNQDVMEFIDELDEAIDDHGIADGTRSGTADGPARSDPSFLFGRPIFDMPSPDLSDRTVLSDKSVSSLQVAVPTPAKLQLKTNRARMA